MDTDVGGQKNLRLKEGHLKKAKKKENQENVKAARGDWTSEKIKDPSKSERRKKGRKKEVENLSRKRHGPRGAEKKKKIHTNTKTRGVGERSHPHLKKSTNQKVFGLVADIYLLK